MDPLSASLIFILTIALVIVISLPFIFGIPFYKFVIAKMRKSMIILMLNPAKRLEIKEATPKSSMIVTKKGNYNFLNTPEAIYTMFGIPVAIAYHSYGAILPPRNIIHASHMKELGFNNIGEVKSALSQIELLLKALLDEKNVLLTRMNKPVFLFSLPSTSKAELEKLKITKPLAKEFKNQGTPIPYSAKISKSNENYFIFTKKGKYIIEPDLKVSSLPLEHTEVSEDLEPELTEIEDRINEALEYRNSLEETTIEKAGIIKIQDIFNFLDKNLSTDVIFSIIERSVAEEMQGMRDYFSKFQQMLPTIITLIIIFTIAYVIVSGNTGGGGMGQGITEMVPNIGIP